MAPGAVAAGAGARGLGDRAACAAMAAVYGGGAAGRAAARGDDGRG